MAAIPVVWTSTWWVEIGAVGLAGILVQGKVGDAFTDLGSTLWRYSFGDSRVWALCMPFLVQVISFLVLELVLELR